MIATYPNKARTYALLGEPLPPGYRLLEFDYLDIDQLAFNMREDPENTQKYLKTLAQSYHPEFQRRAKHGDHMIEVGSPWGAK